MQHEITDLARLSDAESADLAHCEAVIEAGLQTFYETGAALATIRDVGLYRQTHTTFEAYCRGRWGMARQTAYQLITAAGVVENVRNCGQTLPANEAQARPLAVIPSAQRAKVWQEVVETAPPSGITAAHVTETVERFQRADSPVSIVPDAIIDPPTPLPPAVIDILRSPEVRNATLREDFSRVMGRLLAAVQQATNLVRNIEPSEMAELLEDSDLRNEPHIMPTIQWVQAVYAARHNTPAIRRIK